MTISQDIKYELAQEYFDKGHTHLEISRLLGVTKTELYFILNAGSLKNIKIPFSSSEKMKEETKKNKTYVYTHEFWKSECKKEMKKIKRRCFL